MQLRTTQSCWMFCERHRLPQVWKRRHFSAQCFSKRKNLSELKQGASVRTGSRLRADSDTVDIDGGFLDTVSETSGQMVWVVPVFVDKQILDFKVDTGAEVSATSDLSYKEWCGANMSKTNKMLYGLDNSKLDVLGHFTQTLTYRRRISKQQIYVVKSLKNDLLGYLPSEHYNLLLNWTHWKATEQES